MNANVPAECEPFSAEYETFSLEQVCQLTGAPSPDWLSRLIAAGELTAVLAGRDWRMTRSDMCRLVNWMRAAAEQKLAARAATPPNDRAKPRTNTTPANPAGLSKRAAARMRRIAV